MPSCPPNLKPTLNRKPWQHTKPSPRLRGRAGQVQRQRRLNRTHGLCEMCSSEGRVTVAAVVDHIKPLALGGLDVDENTRNLCKRHDDQVTREQFGQRPKPETGEDGWPTT